MVETILEMRNVSKRFPGVQALQDVSFDVRRGEIHALVGQNGAGKSTLLKILAGIYTADTGEIVINGEQATDWGPREVLDHGVSFIYQELNLVPDMTVAQNIMLGREPKAVLGTINWRVLRQRARQALERIGDTTIDVSLPLRQLSVAQQQMVAISRALDQNPGLLVLDEPTSRLSIEEVDRLFALLDGMRAREIAVIYVSHRLEEVYRVADRVTVLRDGRRIATTPTKELPPETLVQQMIGSQVREVTQAKVVTGGQTCLAVENLTSPQVHGVSFELKRGEVLGIVGAVGAGKTEMLRLLFGIDRRSAGRILIDGQEVNIHTPPQAISTGIVLCPEDRKAQGLLLDSSVKNNITLAALRRFSLGGWFLRQRRECQHAEQMVASLRIATPSIHQLARFLSGGNQQKVVLAKWLSTESHIFLFDEPTVGVDVQGKVEIYELLQELAKQGAGVLFVTSDPEEAWAVCGRLLVMYAGHIVAELYPKEVSLDEVMFHVMGGKERDQN